MSHSGHLAKVDTRFWRMKFTSQSDDITGTARSTEGRSHYNGQPALYLSATPAGCIIASKRYFQPGDPPRAIYPLHVHSDRIVDLRDAQACAYWEIDVTHRAVEWQSIRARGLRSPTWDISDRVRELGLDGMLYASRSDPSKTHLTLFQWNTEGTAMVAPDGRPVPFKP